MEEELNLLPRMEGFLVSYLLGILYYNWDPQARARVKEKA